VLEAVDCDAETKNMGRNRRGICTVDCCAETEKTGRNRGAIGSDMYLSLKARSEGLHLGAALCHLALSSITEPDRKTSETTTFHEKSGKETQIPTDTTNGYRVH
jgi:hypothetical protein